MRIWIVGLLALMIGSRAQAESPWERQPSGTTERLRGVSVVDARVVWASGNRGTCLRTVDGGANWRSIVVPNAANLDFRDIHAVDDQTAYLLAIGSGELSRILKTSDGGSTWVESYRNKDPQGFLDAIAFWDADHGLALGDPVAGRFEILATDNGGKSWEKTSTASTMPDALVGEGAFAASGTCLVVGEPNRAWFATGGASKARVFRSTDRGRTWTVAETSVRAGQPSSGIFGLAFLDRNIGLAVGGDYKSVIDPSANLGLTFDGGQTWTTPVEAARRPLGFRSAVAFVAHQPGPTLLAVGPAGTDLSTDGGKTWRSLEGGAEGWHTLGVDPTSRFAWTVGEAGRVGRFSIKPLTIKAP